MLKWIKANQSKTKDWWQTISEAEKTAIDEGLQDIENGEVYDHEVAKKRYEKWL